MAKRLSDAIQMEIIDRFIAGENAAKISRETGIPEKRVLRIVMRKHDKVRIDYRKQRKEAVVKCIEQGLANTQIVDELDENLKYVQNVRHALKRLNDAEDTTFRAL